ncbi:MAG: diaminopimelate decarboxylase, partial [Oscillospiraceae bacterium]|nr:diaminopimelate decarboxylase [Oscillospiraceae bacterium]
MLHTNIGVNAAGRLTFAGLDTAELAARFGTPLYLLDEDRVRARAREYVETMRECMPEGSVPLFAGKALSFAGIYRVVCSEGMKIDVVSQGEIATALAAGADPARMFFHGNNKTDAEIAYAIAHKIGHFIVDGFDELYAVDRAAAEA